MESNYRNSDFEQYVKQNADQYRMFPSEKVWKNIHGTLHTRRKWYGFGLALLLLSTVTAVTWVMVSYPVSKNQRITGVILPQTKPSGSEAAAAESAAANINTADLPFSIKQAIPSSPETKSSAFDFSAPSATGETITEEVISQPGSTTDPDNQRSQFTATIIAPKIASAKSNISPVATISLNEQPLVADNTVTDLTSQTDPAAKTASGTTAAGTHQELSYPLTIESVTNEYRRPRNKRLNIQVYVTPTISYRKLTVNKSLENVAAGNSSNPSFALANLSDVNDFVTHKPDMGVQVGLSGGYPITRNLKVRGGVQLNISRYDIKASLNNPVEAPYDLTSPDGGGVDPVRRWTYFRNSDGVKSDWLKNYYVSISIPIGIEMKLFGGDKTNVGVAGTIQPTYTIKDRAYMISTDYKNYATVPWLMRNVNVSTGFEAFVNYSSGATRWQIGPQVRYQILSSFHNKYPVKENLFDFGLKIGVSLNQ